MSTPSPETPPRLSLRELPLAARLVLSLFLVSVGVGYVSALVQLHFQHAKPGTMMPTGQDAIDLYYGRKPNGGTPPVGKIQQLVEAPETEKFNGTGQMRTAFTTNSTDYDDAVEILKAELEGEELKKAIDKLNAEREGERLALLAWIKKGASKEAYDQDHLDLPPELKSQPITGKFVKGAGGTPAVKIRTLLGNRCVRCHKPEARNDANKFPMDTFEKLRSYAVAPPSVTATNAMSLQKLAQTTHVHLLGFAMLYGLTGLILAFTTYPGWLKLILCPLPLAAQLIDISCWWLARLDPMYAHMIMYTGGIVALGLVLHIVLSLLNMYGVTGKLILLFMFLCAGGGAFVLKVKVIDPYLEHERTQTGAAVTPPNK
jgi:hypothetical protein